MTDPTPTIPTAAAPGEDRPLARVQSECFCETCGASLYLRPVWRSDPQAPLVIRCAGCGAVHAANAFVAGRAPWRRRLNMGLLLLWLGVLIGGVVLLFLAEWAMMEELVADVSWRALIQMDGDAIDGSVSLAPAFRAALPWLAGGLLLPLGAGVFLVSATFHWRRLWHAGLMVLLPLGALALTVLDLDARFVRYAPGDSESAYRAVFGWLALLAGLEMLGGTFSVLVGRRVARGLILALLPPRVQGAFAFLWHRDGKTPPA